MINYISGTILRVGVHTLVIKAGGIGYRVFVPQHVIGSASLHETISLWTSFVVREQSQDLYGFLSYEEYEIFEKVISVSGIGPKGALALFDTLPAQRLVQALVNRDAAAIAQAPGIGKKTAEKIILELADKVELTAGAPTQYTSQNEIMEALMSLGYAPSQVRGVIESIDSSTSFEDQLKEALRLLGSNQ